MYKAQTSEIGEETKFNLFLHEINLLLIEYEIIKIKKMEFNKSSKRIKTK